MSTTPKIDLSSIMKNSKPDTKKETIKAESKKIEPEKIEVHNITIGIKSKAASDTKEIIPKNTTTSDIKKTIVKPKISINRIKVSEIKVSEIKINKPTLTKKDDNLTKKDDTLTKKDDTLTKKDDTLAKKDDNGELFNNYKSDFEGTEDKIIKKVTEKKKAIRQKLIDSLNEPETRIFLVGGLIISTIIGISVLFYLFPESQSLSKYKTSILSNANYLKKTYIDKPWVKNEINLKGNQFNLLIQGKGEETKYKYKGIVYNSKNEIDTFLNKESIFLNNEKEIKKIAKKEKKKKIIKEKIKTVLINKFKNNY